MTLPDVNAIRPPNTTALMAVVAFWFLCALFVAFNITYRSDEVLVTFVAWVGGVLSLLQVHMLWTLWKIRRVNA